MSRVPLEISCLRDALVEQLVTRLELVPEDARLTVDHLIRAEQAGKRGHGLIRISYTTTSGKFGPYHNTPAPAPRRLGPGHLQVDGSGHFGYPVMHKLIEAGCEEARSQGMCIATSVSVYPSGALGDWARLAARKGVGLILVASSPRRVAPLGGTQPVVGTNAICIGVPTDPMPFVSDSATSQITHGLLLLARQSGETLPENSAMRPDGKPTRSADEVAPARGIGALLPIGASHKAFALGMGIELLGSLGGGRPGGSKVGEHGVFGLFLGPSIFEPSLSTMSNWLCSLDEQGTRIPGWTSGRRVQDQQQRDVVEVPKETFNALSAVLAPSALRRSGVKS